MFKKGIIRMKVWFYDMRKYENRMRMYENQKLCNSIKDCSNSNLHSRNTLFWLKSDLKKGIIEIVVWV